MSTFLAYNTDDPGAAAAGYTTLPANGTVTLGPIQAGVGAKIAGSCYSDSPGTLWVYQSFDWSQTIDPTTGNRTSSGHWDVVQPAGGQAIAGGTPFTIEFDVIAPVMQVVFTNGATVNNHLRIFVRVFGNRNST